MTGRFMQYAAPHMAAAHTTVTTKLATEGSGRYHTRSSPTGPAEQEEGGSLDEQSISASWKPKDDVLNSGKGSALRTPKAPRSGGVNDTTPQLTWTTTKRAKN
jgi:hypothetical protein